MNSFEQEFFKKLINLVDEYNVNVSTKHNSIAFAFVDDELLPQRCFTVSVINKRVHYIEETNLVNIYQES